MKYDVWNCFHYLSIIKKSITFDEIYRNQEKIYFFKKLKKPELFDLTANGVCLYGT